MSIWFDMRLLELWHRVTHMQDSRLAKKIVLAAPGGRSAGGRQMLWMDKVKAALERWEIDEARAASLNYSQFKHSLKKKMPEIVKKLFLAAETSSPAVREYHSKFSGPSVTFKRARPYLSQGPCDKGKELVLQLRTGSLPLASLTGKFGRSRRENPHDPLHFQCPVCATAEESQSHFLLDCPAYAERREGLLSALEAEAPARFSAFSSLGAGEKATALVSDSFWGEGDWLVGSLVAPYVYACWQKRCEILHPEHTASGPPTQREVDGLAAMA